MSEKILKVEDLTEGEKVRRIKWWESIIHFTYDEYDSPDSIDSGLLMNPEFIFTLDQIRSKVGFPLFISSGFRTPEHNAKVAKVEKSAHTFGLAADLVVHNSKERDAVLGASYLFKITRKGIGNTFVHLDMDYTKPQHVSWLYE